MAQYETLQAEIKRCKLELQQLEQKASEVLDLERTRAVDELRAMLRTFEAFDITAFDLGLTSSKASSSSSPVVHKYRNPVTGETFSGKGNSPAWLDKNDPEFLNPEWLARPKPSKTWKLASSSKPTIRTVDVTTNVTSEAAPTEPVRAHDSDFKNIIIAGESKVSAASDRTPVADIGDVDAALIYTT